MIEKSKTTNFAWAEVLCRTSDGSMSDMVGAGPRKKTGTLTHKRSRSSLTMNHLTTEKQPPTTIQEKCQQVLDWNMLLRGGAIISMPVNCWVSRALRFFRRNGVFYHD